MFQFTITGFNKQRVNVLSSQTARQKTLSVKWNQSMSETRLFDRRNVQARRTKDSTYRNRPPPLPRLSSVEFMSRKDSLPTATATTPLMAIPSQINATESTCTNEICDCIIPHGIMINGDKFKSESC